jgi:hypothetical protein
MAEIVLRVLLLGGDHMDVTYDEPRAVDQTAVVDDVITVVARFAPTTVTGSSSCAAAV